MTKVNFTYNFILIKSATQKELLKQLLENPDLLSSEERGNLIKNLIANMENLDRYITLQIMSFALETCMLCLLLLNSYIHI